VNFRIQSVLNQINKSSRSITEELDKAGISLQDLIVVKGRSDAPLGETVSIEITAPR